MCFLSNNQTLDFLVGRLPALLEFWHVGWLVDSEAHRTVSMGSPRQAAADGAFLQWRSRNFMSQDADRSHSDHSPHSDQASKPAKEAMETKLPILLSLVLA